MVIFHSYVSLPEGIINSAKRITTKSGKFYRDEPSWHQKVFDIVPNCRWKGWMPSWRSQALAILYVWMQVACFMVVHEVVIIIADCWFYVLTICVSKRTYTYTYVYIYIYKYDTYSYMFLWMFCESHAKNVTWHPPRVAGGYRCSDLHHSGASEGGGWVTRG